MRDGSTAVHTTAVSISVSFAEVNETQSSWLGLAGGVAALRSGGNMPADHMQSLSSGHVSEHDETYANTESVLSWTSDGPVMSPVVVISLTSGKYFLHTFSPSSLSYISRSSATELIAYRSLSLVTKYGILVQHAIGNFTSSVSCYKRTHSTIYQSHREILHSTTFQNNLIKIYVYQRNISNSVFLFM